MPASLACRAGACEMAVAYAIYTFGPRSGSQLGNDVRMRNVWGLEH
jgi:hypothetical protein